MDPNSVFKRPNPDDSEADLIKFQNLFLAEKSKNTNFQPAAKVIRLTNPGEGRRLKQMKIKNSIILLLLQIIQHCRKCRNLLRNEAYRKKCLQDKIKVKQS